VPRVPTYDNFQVQPNVLPDQKFTGALGVEQATLPGRQMQATGDLIQRGASQAIAMEANELDQANALRVSDAKNKAKELQFRLKYDKEFGYTNLKDVSALQRPDGKPLADEYAEKYQKGIGEIADSLGNDAQKETYLEWANSALTDFHGQAMAYEGEQFKTYAMSVHEGTIKNAINDVGLNYNNPEAISKSIEEIKAAAYDAAKMQNKSAAYAEAQARDLTSKAHLAALEAAMQRNDPTYADGYMKKFSKDMNADDILKAEGVLTKQMDSQIALGVADKVMQGAATKIETPNSERAFNIAVNTESGGRQFGKDGQPLTSPKGAVGIAQVMPQTAPEAAKLAGVEWDEERYKTDADYNRQLGKALFDDAIKASGGDLSLAYAEYNLGRPKLNIAKARAEKEGGAWIDYVPKETQDYVRKNLAAYEKGEGRNSLPTLEELKDQVRTQVGASRPERLKLALSEVENRYNDRLKAIKQRDERTVAEAMQEIVNNGGKYSSLSADMRAALPAEDVGKVMDFAKKIAEGDDTTDERLYQELSDPAKLRGYTEDQFFMLRSGLSQADFKHFANERAKLVSGNVTNGPGELNSSAIKTTLDDRLRTIGVDPSPSGWGSTSAAKMRVGAIRKFVNESIAAAQANSGKKMTDAEVQQHIDGLFARTTTYNAFIGSSSGPMLGMKAKDIPGAAEEALRAEFKKLGVSDPTDGQLLDAYWRGISKGK